VTICPTLGDRIFEEKATAGDTHLDGKDYNHIADECMQDCNRKNRGKLLDDGGIKDGNFEVKATADFNHIADEGMQDCKRKTRSGVCAPQRRRARRAGSEFPAQWGPYAAVAAPFSIGRMRGGVRLDHDGSHIHKSTIR
jgi:hypothetical protein